MFRMKTRHFIILIISFMMLPHNLNAQEKDSIETTGLNWHAYPIIFYSPESNLAFGALGIISFRLSNKQNSKPSKIEAYGYYTLNTQYSFSMKPEIYFDDDKFYLSSYLNYSKVIDKFFDIGNNTKEVENPNYEARSSLVLIKFQRQISHNLNAGVVYEIRNYNVVDVRENPYLQSGMVYGRGGGLTSGLGFVVSYDSRNNIFYPASGGFYELSSTFFTREIGSDFGYTKTIIDLRRFQKISSNQILAFQMFYNFITGSSPFYDVPPLGGENIMRGYFTGRYRDRHYFATQIEYRIRVWWRFGLVGFIGMGDVASSLTKFEMTKFKFSYGLGIRIRIDEIELIDLRADVGFGKNTSGIYFSLNQAF
jgi:hypothetical protein